MPGSFVAVSSISARLVDRNMGLYSASKAALSMLVKVAAAEWGDLALRVNAVAPGVTRTPMLGRGPSATVTGSPWLANVADRTALGRLGEASDIAEVILGVHAMAWLTGQVVECDGGLSLHSPIDSYGEMVRARAKPRRAAGRGVRYEVGADVGLDADRSPSHTIVSRSFDDAASCAAAWQVAPTSAITAAALTSCRTAPTS